MPKNIRESLGIKKYGKVVVESEKNFIKIRPVFDILDIAGSLKPKTKKSVLKARAEMEKTYSRP